MTLSLAAADDRGLAEARPRRLDVAADGVGLAEARPRRVDVVANGWVWPKPGPRGVGAVPDFSQAPDVAAR
jgi:hypothetical protein